MTAAAVDGGGGCGTVLVNMCCTGHMLIHTGAHLSDQWIQPRLDGWMASLTSWTTFTNAPTTTTTMAATIATKNLCYHRTVRRSGTLDHGHGGGQWTWPGQGGLANGQCAMYQFTHFQISRIWCDDGDKLIDGHRYASDKSIQVQQLCHTHAR